MVVVAVILVVDGTVDDIAVVVFPTAAAVVAQVALGASHIPV
jgi:hypothetical protein